MARITIAIVAGFLVAAVLAVGGDIIVRQMAPGAIPDAGHPETGWLLLALVYTSLGAFAGGIVSAQLTPERETRAALLLGGVMLVFGVVAVIGRPDTAPLWYHVTSLALVMPVVYAGARWRASRRRGQAGADLPKARRHLSIKG